MVPLEGLCHLYLMVLNLTNSGHHAEIESFRQKSRIKIYCFHHMPMSFVAIYWQLLYLHWSKSGRSQLLDDR